MLLKMGLTGTKKQRRKNIRLDKLFVRVHMFIVQWQAQQGETWKLTAWLPEIKERHHWNATRKITFRSWTGSISRGVSMGCRFGASTFNSSLIKQLDVLHSKCDDRQQLVMQWCCLTTLSHATVLATIKYWNVRGNQFWTYQNGMLFLVGFFFLMCSIQIPVSLLESCATPMAHDFTLIYDKLGPKRTEHACLIC